MDKRTLPDLTKNTKSVTIILSGSIGYTPLPDDVQKIGIITAGSTARISINAVPSSASTVIGGSATIDNYQAGMPLTGSSINGVDWFEIGFGVDRELYLRDTDETPQITVIFV